MFLTIVGLHRMGREAVLCCGCRSSKPPTQSQKGRASLKTSKLYISDVYGRSLRFEMHF
jgi:hypothetical protein